MSLIRILPESLSNKIAAGEVVERPASVVKELIENAIDAESTRVTVEVKKGGRILIRVSDNGIGMERDDALLALERHATSKIYDEKDLFSIRTLGFRGEALPSIASVSDLELVTRPESADVGTRIIVQGGTIKGVSEAGAPKGTTILVNRLFFNTPVRRKHLKTERTEMGHISDMVTRIALAWPGIHFKLFHNGLAVANWSPTQESVHRVGDVLRNGMDHHLYEVNHAQGDVRVQGFVASPDITRTTSRGLYAYVNGRFVRDSLLHHAIRDGYAHRLMKGKYPVAVLFLTLPRDQVDVNVHPTKNLVRFETPQEIHDTVAKAVSSTLQSLDRPRWGKKAAFRSVQSQQYDSPLPSHGNVSEPLAKPLPRSPSPPVQTLGRLWEDKPFSSLRILGQIHNTYIVCEAEDGLVLIDQHAAHERVVFESLKNAYGRSAIVTQGLLIPERLEVSHREGSILDGLLDALREMGIEIEPFGGNTYIVRSVPDILAGKPVKPMLMEIIEKVAEIGLASGLHRAVEECLMIMACHGAIRAKEKLSDQEMKALLKQLDGLEDGMHCPHGRPTLIRQRLHQIEKDFKRLD